jgi:ATP-dependent RNA helicase DHX29
LHSIAVGSALDWLLLHLDKNELPKQYADQVQTFGDVELRHKGKSTSTTSSSKAAAAAAEASAAVAAAAEAVRLLKEKEAAAKASEIEEKNRLEAEEKEKAARRAWILQYAESSSSSSEEEESDDAAASHSNKSPTGSIIEDWEVWGDQREVDRRRAERARSALNREDRLELIATELATTMAGAAKAKASGDKAEQRMFGQMIGQLKREMAELGITEADLPQVGGNGNTAAAAASASAASGKEKRKEVEHGDKDSGSEENNGNLSALDAENSEASSSESSEDEEEEESLGFDIFDSGAVAELESVPGADKRIKRRAKAMAAAALQPWGGARSSAPGGGKKKGGQKTAVEAVVVQQQPKAALHQACQKYGLAAPRYERLDPGGSRDPSEGGGDYRYSVTIDPGTTVGTAVNTTKKQVGKNKKSKTVKRIFTLPEVHDGWAKIEDAQNASATLALLAIFSKEEEEEGAEFWKLLPMPFSELWLALEEEGAALLESEEESDETIATRDNFVRELIASKQQEESIEERNLEEEARLAAEQISWAETLKRKLAQRHQNPKVAAIETATSERMLKDLKAWRNSSQGAEWQKSRGNLPASALREQLRQMLQNQDVLVVSGETGSGKTTQVPQFILENETESGQGGKCSVVCTQPRRIAAISVAERVASERGEPAPGERGSAVGYAVRLDSATTSDTRLLFCTTGILLRRLASDPALSTVTHVVVDEVHERTLQGDFLIALLKDLLVHRRAAGFPLKVILMSATLDSGLLTEYFGGCPVLHAPGRTFPVEQFFLEDAMEVTGYVLAPDAPAALRPGGARRDRQRRLENAAGARNRAAVRSGWGDDEADEILNPNYDEEQYEGYTISVKRNMARVNEDRIDFDLLEDLVGYIHENEEQGAILVFLPGMAEISNLHRRLEASRRFAGCWLVPLHSTVAPSDQRKAFKRPPKDVRKIVIATNIAETSLTIEDVVYVVDSGKLKERRHDAARSMSLLVEDWVSVASAKQRRGRAGRVREGICYGLYSRDRFERRMKPYQTPEMARVPLEELVLQVHLLRVASSAALFASRVLQPPPAKAVDGALRVLREVGALNEAEVLTPLGHYLAQLPVDARVGKLLLFAASLGCLAPALTIAACLSHKPPFATGLAAADGSEKARTALAAAESGTIAAGQQSDHLVMAAAVDGWLLARRKNSGRKAASEFARKYCLSEQTLDMLSDMRGQFASMLAEIGFLSTDKSKSSLRPTSISNAGQQRVPWYDDSSLPCNQYAHHPAVLKAVLFAALYPNVAAMDVGDTGPGRRPSWHDGTGQVAIHPGSICSDLDSARFLRPFLTYLEKVRTSQVFLRDCTVVSPAALVLFGGQLEVDHAAGRVSIDGWLRVKVPAKTAALVRKLREALEALLKKKVIEPRRDIGDAGGAAVVAAIVGLLDFEEAAQSWT